VPVKEDTAYFQLSAALHCLIPKWVQNTLGLEPWQVLDLQAKTDCLNVT